MRTQVCPSLNADNGKSILAWCSLEWKFYQGEQVDSKCLVPGDRRHILPIYGEIKI